LNNDEQGLSKHRLLNAKNWFLTGWTVKNPIKQTSKSKRRSQQSGKPPKAWQPEVSNGDESAEAEQIDRLLTSSLRLWEVEREIIEERRDARKSTSKDKEV